MEINQILGNRIKHFRKKFGMTQEEFANLIGVEPLHISNVERGKKGLSLDVMVSICDHLNISMDDLLPVGDQKSECEHLKNMMINEIVAKLSQANIIMS